MTTCFYAKQNLVPLLKSLKVVVLIPIKINDEIYSELVCFTIGFTKLNN